MILLVVAAWFVLVGIWGTRMHRKKARDRHELRLLRMSFQHMAHALRVGVSFQQALERASRQTEPPLDAEWRRVMNGVQTGQPLHDALEELPQRIPRPEVRTFVSAVLISQQTGGSLANVLETLAATLVERETLYDKVKALTAQGQASGIVLCAMPFALLLALRVLSPALISPLFSTGPGQLLLLSVLFLVSAGGFTMHRIIEGASR